MTLMARIARNTRKFRRTPVRLSVLSKLFKRICSREGFAQSCDRGLFHDYPRSRADTSYRRLNMAEAPERNGISPIFCWRNTMLPAPSSLTAHDVSGARFQRDRECL